MTYAMYTHWPPQFFTTLDHSLSLLSSSAHVFVCVEVGSREAAFVHAISSAGVVHAITRACSEGSLRNCACDPTKVGSSSDRRGKFDWGGCSDNVRYGSHFARMFVDARDKRVRDARALMNLQNNRAGRRVGDSQVIDLATPDHHPRLLLIAGRSTSHDAGVQVSRGQRGMHHPHLLAGHAGVR